MSREKKELKNEDLVEIKKNLDSKRLILGTERTLKSLKQGNLEKVYMSANCSKTVMEDLLYYSKIGNVSVVALDIPNDELGVVCKKPFSVSVAGLLRS